MGIALNIFKTRLLEQCTEEKKLGCYLYGEHLCVLYTYKHRLFFSNCLKIMRSSAFKNHRAPVRMTVMLSSLG